MAEALTDLERRVYSRFLNFRRASGAGIDQKDLIDLAKLAVDTLTTGSASGRRLRAMDRRETDPGCTPDKIRTLAESIEDSFTTMPNGWVRQRDLDARRTYG
jgi:hypothetical protein